MDKEMQNFKPHDILDLALYVPGRIWLGTPLEIQECHFEQNKARLVTRSDLQEPGIDYNKSCFPVVGLESPRTSDLDVIQFDITSACLHSTFKEEIYIEQPDDHTDPRKRNWVWYLKKGLCGLVQTGSQEPP